MSPGHAEQAKSDIGNKKAAVSLNADASWLNKKIGTAQSDISMTPKSDLAVTPSQGKERSPIRPALNVATIIPQ